MIRKRLFWLVVLKTQCGGASSDGLTPGRDQVAQHIARQDAKTCMMSLAIFFLLKPPRQHMRRIVFPTSIQTLLSTTVRLSFCPLHTSPQGQFQHMSPREPYFNYIQSVAGAKTQKWSKLQKAHSKSGPVPRDQARMWCKHFLVGDKWIIASPILSPRRDFYPDMYIMSPRLLLIFIPFEFFGGSPQNGASFIIVHKTVSLTNPQGFCQPFLRYFP